MKKSIMAAFAAIFLGAACVGFAACGTAGDSAEIAKDAAKNIVSIKVTEAEWNAAFAYLALDDAGDVRDDRECSIEMSAETSGKFNNQIDVISTRKYTCRVKGGKTYYKGEEKSEYGEQVEQSSIEQYTAVENGTRVVYTKNETGSWEKDEYDYIRINGLFSFIGSYSSITDYEYNATAKGYVLTASSSGPKTIYKFGKVGDAVRLVAIYQSDHFGSDETSADEIYEGSYIISYTNVADITLPDVG